METKRLMEWDNPFACAKESQQENGAEKHEYLLLKITRGDVKWVPLVGSRAQVAIV